MDSPKKLCLLSSIIYFMYSSTSDATCSLPDELQSSTWEYNYTHVIDNSERSATIFTGTKTMQTSVIYDVQGTKLDRWTCINSLNISNTQDVVVFKSDTSFTIGPSSPSRWLYLCMKITKVTDDLFYFYLLSDVFTGVTPKERVFAPDSSAPSHNAPTCRTFCQYTSSPKIRTLRKQGTNDVLPNDSSLCEPCDSACDVACTLPPELHNFVWDYQYTDLSNNAQTTTLTFGRTTLTKPSNITLNALGTVLNAWTCIANLKLSSAVSVAVFKSDESYVDFSGNTKWVYLCMKLTKVADDLFYFYLLSDEDGTVYPKERVYQSGSIQDKTVPVCSTFCQYTTKPRIRTLKKSGSNTTLPSDVSLCEPCDSSCEEESMYRCLKNTDRFDIKWNRTAGNTLVTVSCTGEYTGTVSRNCSSSGMWDEPDYTQCRSKFIKNLMQQMDKLLAGDSEFPLVSATLGNLANITKSNNELRTGDIVTVSALLGDIAKYVTNDTDKISVDQLENFGSICNELLDEKYHRSWEELKDKGTSDVTTVVKAVTEYTSAFRNVLDGESSMTVKKENIVITVGKSSSPEITFPDRQTNDSWITDSGTEMKLKQSMCSDLTGYSCTFFRNISGLFPKYLLLNRKVLSFDGIYDVNSIIADVSIESGSCSDYSLELRFGHLLGNHSRPVCGFWDFNASNTVNGAWSSFGSLVAESGDSYTLCKYNHTTNFAILMSPGRTPSPHNFPLSMISAIGCGVSILFLVVTIVIHIVLWRYVRNDRTKALMNLCVALVLSYVIFLAGITRTENKNACTAIAVALHYMFLTDFAMMLAEGILIVRMVIIVFPTKSIVNWLLPACWAVPGIIVGISAGVTKLSGYGNRNFCWLTLESNLIWAFIGPALLVILINFVIINITVYKMMTTKGLAKKTLEEKSRIGLKSICVILPLFGVTWVLGAFSVNEDLVMFQYLFAIFNSLQGLFICLFHCFLNKQIRQGYNHYQRRRKSNRSNSMMSTDTSNYVSIVYTDIKITRIP
ncbi:adhesion G protein-coupled receptor B3-like isoform X2 [Mytilus edulis]|uniref:adhesion G protein-coupled receptor B3-like isoform X2 n=1 Tax=Mytilus edulis TaxID=6550 RepID=UPI0039EE4657